MLLEPISIIRAITGCAGIAGLATANSLARPSDPTGQWLTEGAGIAELATANSLARPCGVTAHTLSCLVGRELVATCQSMLWIVLKLNKSFFSFLVLRAGSVSGSGVLLDFRCIQLCRP